MSVFNNTDENLRFMRKAIELSQKNIDQNGGGPFGAIIVREGQILGAGWNKVTLIQDPTAHAEVEAIREACKKIGNFDLSGAEIYTSCEPCPMCLAAIYWARISKIYYANNRNDAEKIDFSDNLIYDEIGKPLSERKIPLVQILREEAIQVFQNWEKKADRKKY